MQRYRLLATSLAALGAVGLAHFATADIADRYVKTPTGYLVVLKRGDDVFKHLEDLARREKVPSATLSGIGFLGEVSFGFYDFSKKEFDPKKTFNDVELSNLTGSIAWKEGAPSLHIHGTVGDRTFSAFGGHVLSAVVGTGSLEVTVTVHSDKLERRVDPEIGANVLQLQQ